MKRNAAGDEMEAGSHKLWGSVSARAAALLGGGAAAAGAGAAALPKFLSVPGLRRSPSGLEVDENGGVLEQSPSSYYEMDGPVGETHQGVELSRNGSLTAPYMV